MNPIAYAYQADLICYDCYDEIINLQHIETPADIMDESSFDSDEFPKAVFTLENSRREHCGNCDAELDTSLIHESGDDECECERCCADRRALIRGCSGDER